MHLSPRFLCLFAILALLPLALPVQAADAVPQSREQITLTFAPLVKKAAPAVVNIYTRRTVKTRMPPIFADPIFRQFFGEQMGVPRERVERSLGSGVIVRPDGVVVTNNHVVKDSDEITVVLADRREYEAKVLGTDERTDLAVLKINAGSAPLPTLPLADSDALEVGDVVLAIGDPFGVGQTVTMGIVSALARTAVGASDYRFFIQTDAAINPGNSGGALIDMAGRVVGINSAIFSQSGGSIGIGFAIPANMVKVVLASITSGGKLVRPWLGASGQAVTADMFQSLKLDRPVGVLVNAVRQDSPAQQAGIAVGDVITAVDGHEVDDPEAMRYRIATKPVDAVIKLTLIRAGQPVNVQATLTAPPDVPPRQITEIKGQVPFAGATVANLNPALQEELDIPGNEHGVIVTAVKPEGIAARMGIQPGDRVVRINDEAIKSVDEMMHAVNADREQWQLAINRNGQVMTMTLGP
ncbi:MAG TPA: DegQ family serine endoprotease [Magnetospirillaceae bacterium]|jgi:serine protease Do